MARIAAKPKSTDKPPVTKLCLKCNQTRMISEFYSNRDWTEQLGRDIWCKNCVSKIKTKDGLREYFWENHRAWNERVWENSIKKAELAASKNQTYQKISEDRRMKVLEELACQNMVKAMMMNYKYFDSSKENVTSYQEAKETGMIVEEKDDNVKTFSEDFNGYFKPSELKYLREYYLGLDHDFDLSDTNQIDMAKKLAKASLQADKVQDDYMAGRCSLADVKDAMALFDLLSKSGNFAASKRKQDGDSTLTSWAETTYILETTGHPCTRQIEWPKDDVDKTIDEFRHIVESLSLDSV